MQDIGLDAEVKNAIEKDEVSKLKVAAKKYKGWKKVSKTVKECGFTQLSAEWGPWEFSLHYAILAGAEGCSFWLMTMCPGLLGVQLRHPDVRKGRLSDEDGVSEVKEDGDADDGDSAPQAEVGDQSPKDDRPEAPLEAVEINGTPLHLSVQFGHTSITKAICAIADSEPDSDVRQNMFWHCMYAANTVARQCGEAVFFLKEYPSYLAAARDDVESLAAIIDATCDPQGGSLCRDGCIRLDVPLVNFCAKYGSNMCFDMLLSTFQPEELGTSSNTLIEAAWRPAMLAKLLRMRHASMKVTAEVLCAGAFGGPAVLQLLLSHSTMEEVNGLGKFGMTPLIYVMYPHHCLEEVDQVAMATMLIEFGADRSIKRQGTGMTAYDYATTEETKAAVKPNDERAAKRQKRR